LGKRRGGETETTQWRHSSFSHPHNVH